MSLSNLKLESTLPSDWSQLSEEDRSIYDRLPDDYRAFLNRRNGGFVAPDSLATFSIPIDRMRDGKVVSIMDQNDVEEFYTLIPSTSPYTREYGRAPASLLHEHWGRHQGEEFLPYDVIVFASCTQSCLLAISLNREDYGAIYYWEWYWQYPWFAQFFEQRIAQAKSKYADLDEVLSNQTHPFHREAFNALNYATLVKVANSFTEFVESLRSDENV